MVVPTAEDIGIRDLYKRQTVQETTISRSIRSLEIECAKSHLQPVILHPEGYFGSWYCRNNRFKQLMDSIDDTTDASGK